MFTLSKTCVRGLSRHSPNFTYFRFKGSQQYPVQLPSNRPTIMAAKDRTEAFIEEKTQNGNPREKEALEYIKKHKVMELFDNFTAQLLYSRPCKSHKSYYISIVH